MNPPHELIGLPRLDDVPRSVAGAPCLDRFLVHLALVAPLVRAALGAAFMARRPDAAAWFERTCAAVDADPRGPVSDAAHCAAASLMWPALGFERGSRHTAYELVRKALVLCRVPATACRAVLTPWSLSGYFETADAAEQRRAADELLQWVRQRAAL